MTCEALINTFLMDYHAGKLSTARRLDFQLHLTLCRACRRYVDSYRKTIMLTKRAVHTDETVPEELVQAILKITNDHGSQR